MKAQLARKVAIPKGARRKTYYDTQEIITNESQVNFFPAQANRNPEMANYISNAFPGEDARLVYGMTFVLTRQFIQTDDAAQIDPIAIVNGLKDAAVIATADQNYKEFLRVPLSDHFDFDSTRLNLAAAFAGQAASADSEYTVEKTVTLQDDLMIKVSDPFVVAPNQVFTLTVHFADSSVFPAAADWENSGLFLQCRLNVAELTPEMQL